MLLDVFGRQVQHLGAGVLVLTLAGERHREHLALGVLAGHPDRRVLHGDLRPDVAVDPLHGGAGLGAGPLGDQVVDVVRPVLDRGVTATATGLDDDLHHRRVQRIRLVDRRGAALDVVHVGALVDDDQRPLELAHVLGVDPEVGLQRDVDVHTRRDVDERSAHSRPRCSARRTCCRRPGSRCRSTAGRSRGAPAARCRCPGR